MPMKTRRYPERGLRTIFHPCEFDPAHVQLCRGQVKRYKNSFDLFGYWQDFLDDGRSRGSIPRRIILQPMLPLKQYPGKPLLLIGSALPLQVASRG